MGNKLIVSASPHIRSKESMPKVMWSVVCALLPAAAIGVYFFGWPALQLIVVCCAVAVITEALTQRLMGYPIAITDGSCVVTGLLCALILPPGLPWWMGAIGAGFAIVVVKQLFGGLGFNIFNPALAARVVLLASFPIHMTAWVGPFDGVSCATPLAIVKDRLSIELPTYWDLFVGNVAGSIGETSVVCLLVGAGYLFLRRIISWHIPFSYIGTVAFLSWLFGRDPIFSVLAGGLILGAFFMATDMVTTPITKKGKLIFGVGAGVIVVVIRHWGGYPEGVCYSILLMNGITPLIDRWTRPKGFGRKRQI